VPTQPASALEIAEQVPSDRRTPGVPVTPLKPPVLPDAPVPGEAPEPVAAAIPDPPLPRFRPPLTPPVEVPAPVPPTFSPDFVLLQLYVDPTAVASAKIIKDCRIDSPVFHRAYF
jgi:hypothetical protein